MQKNKPTHISRLNIMPPATNAAWWSFYVHALNISVLYV